jgi:MoxR-like ATPase
MLKVVVDYNTKEEEKKIINLVTKTKTYQTKVVADIEKLEKTKKAVQRVHIDEELKDYIVDIIFATREPSQNLKNLIDFGASPRASIALYKASKAYAYLQNRDYVTPVDIATMAKDVLRHRIILSYDAIAEDKTTDEIIDMILEEVLLP